MENKILKDITLKVNAKDIEKTLKDLSKEQDSKYKVYTESLEFLERLDKEFKRKYNNGD